MALVRLNILENISGFGNIVRTRMVGNATLQIHHVYIPGSISFNNIAVIGAASGTTAKTVTFSFGLYSLNGSTLSIANSASRTWNPSADQTSWISLATSATQDITPGDWYFAFMSSTSSNSRISFMAYNALNLASAGAYGGAFFRGWLSVSTSELPSSIATSDLSKEGASGTTGFFFHPYILISA